MILQNLFKRIVGSILINISPQTVLLLEIFYQNNEAAFGGCEH